MKKKTAWQKFWMVIDFIGTLTGIWFFLMIVLICIFGGEIKIQVNWSSWLLIPRDIRYCILFMIVAGIGGFFVIRKEWNRPIPGGKGLKRLTKEEVEQISKETEK